MTRQQQTLIAQAIGCVDKVLSNLHEGKREMMEWGMSAYQYGVVAGKLVDVVGELEKVSRLIPGAFDHDD